MTLKMPNNFLFAAASISYPIEGAWKEDGKGLSNWDVFSKIPGKTFEHTNGDVAVDHYHRYKEDIALMAEMGIVSFLHLMAAYFQNGTGEVNEKGLEFYNNLIDEWMNVCPIRYRASYHFIHGLLCHPFGDGSSRSTRFKYRGRHLQSSLDF